ncbi:MAG: diguanylate cyclase [Gammaproteobacteria bacterium]|nr:diguanylate cyclase [Gammaproteobacteria bacterium]
MADRILVVDDDAPIREMIAEVLTDCAYSVELAFNAENALEKFKVEKFDLAIVDIRLGGMNGVDLLREIKKISPNTHVIIITSYASMESAIAVLKEGAYDYLIKPFEDMELIVSAVRRAMDNLHLFKEKEQLVEMLKQRNAELERANVRLSELAVLDGLTGLYNHRHLQETLAKELARATRHSRDLSVVFIDVDHFKNYNDTHGHQAGDFVLKALSEIMLHGVRKGDIVARYGGEEFVIILPETNSQEAGVVAEKIRLLIEKHPFTGKDTQPNGIVSVSIGVSSLSVSCASSSALLAAADSALYKAKSAGRNQVVVA